MTVADVVAAVDAFMATTKIVVGANRPVPWADGYNSNERVIYLPLEVNGEQTGAKLMVVGFPNSTTLKSGSAYCFLESYAGWTTPTKHIRIA